MESEGVIVMMLDQATKDNIKDHILNHHDGFPTTKQKLVEACEGMSDFTPEVKKWFEEALPGGTYNNAEEVFRALSL